MAAPPPHVKIPSAALSAPLSHPYHGSAKHDPSPADAEAGRASPAAREGGGAGPLQSQELAEMCVPLLSLSAEGETHPH